MKKDAENRVKRATLFSKEFGLVLIHGESKEELKANRRLCDAWYTRRNAIVHGRKREIMILAEYLKVEVFVYRSMTHIAQQCLVQHKLRV